MFETGASTFRLGFFWGALVLFLLLELTISYRPNTVSKFKRWVNNLALTLLNSILLQLIFAGAIFATLAYTQQHKVGLLHLVSAPAWIEFLITLIFMDFMLYVWHLLNHEVPFLWRFHRVHHSDLNMDVSTATRFHFGELGISAVIKMGLIFFLGPSALALVIFESAIVFCAQLHHSSFRVPRWLENIYWILFVPPSMHRIHHSVVIKERDTNYGTIFSLWDRFLGTLTQQVDQNRIKIGMGAYRNPEKLHFQHMLLMPFTRSVR